MRQKNGSEWLGTRAFINGVIHTLDQKNSIFQAMLVEDGVIRRLGTTEEITALGGQSVDLEGRTVIPGFNDSHLHLLSYGMAVNSLDLRECQTKEAVLEKAREKVVQERPDRLWMAGFVNPYLFTRQELDKVSTHIPVFYTRVNGHTYAPTATVLTKLCCNTRALELAGICRNSQIPGVLMDEDGPTGILKGKSADLVRSLLPPLTRAQKKEALATATALLASRGFTSVHSNDMEQGDLELLEIFRELEQEGRLPLRVNMQCLFDRVEDFEAFMEKDPRPSFNTRRHRLGALKLILDGTLGERTAALHKPYCDAPGNCGTLLFTREELEDLVKIAHRLEMQVVMHAIGDRAIDQAIEVFESIQDKLGRKDLRHGIVHCLITGPNAFSRMGRCGVTALIQPVAVASDYTALDSRLGPERMEGIYGWKSMLDHGIMVSGGTDCPCEEPDPFEGLACTITRQNGLGEPAGGFLPGERLTLEQALRIMTVNGAYLSQEEEIKGSLEPGKLGDFIVLDQDIFMADPQNIRLTHCLATVSGGKIVYASSNNIAMAAD